MEFENSFNIGDIIGVFSLIIGIIGLVRINPVYRHFHVNKNNNKIGNLNENKGIINFYGGTFHFNQEVVENPILKDTDDDLFFKKENNEE